MARWSKSRSACDETGICLPRRNEKLTMPSNKRAPAWWVDSSPANHCHPGRLQPPGRGEANRAPIGQQVANQCSKWVSHTALGFICATEPPASVRQNLRTQTAVSAKKELCGHGRIIGSADQRRQIFDHNDGTGSLCRRSPLVSCPPDGTGTAA